MGLPQKGGERDLLISGFERSVKYLHLPGSGHVSVYLYEHFPLLSLKGDGTDRQDMFCLLFLPIQQNSFSS